MKLVAGIDIGNSTTEACVGYYLAGQCHFVGSSSVSTTGLKGTVDNLTGIKKALEIALKSTNYSMKDLYRIRVNKAAPVMGATAMETITETLVTESTMVGHNPDTPSGLGIGVGYTVWIDELHKQPKTQPYLVLVEDMAYDDVANHINSYREQGYEITGILLKNDEAVLVYNRLNEKCPILDEITGIGKIPSNQLGIVEVALTGESIQVLSNPYDIATLFKLNPDETRQMVTIAKSLMGKQSGFLVKTPSGEMEQHTIKAGKIYLHGSKKSHICNVEDGATAIMDKIQELQPLKDVTGEDETHIGDMLHHMRDQMSSFIGCPKEDIHVEDLLAVDTLKPITVRGGIAGEVSLENAVSIGAMVKAETMPMSLLAQAIEKDLGVPTHVDGIEAVMATTGALTTPGLDVPLLLCDLGGGSTDLAYLHDNGDLTYKHFAGAGNMVTMLINTELGLEDTYIAENIKKYPLGKVESLYHMRLEDGKVLYQKEPFAPRLFGRIVIRSEQGLIPILKDVTMEKIVSIRKDAKKRVFLTNILRGLRELSQDDKVCKNMILVGGSALDFELASILLEALWKEKIVVGRGNIQGQYGPRMAVATGLLLQGEKLC